LTGDGAPPDASADNPGSTNSAAPGESTDAASIDRSDGEQPLTEREQRDYEQIRQNLLPESGDGPRCPKCASLLDETLDNCPRCGLNLDRADSYDSGEAPWETPPSGREDAHERAEQLWQQAKLSEDGLDADALEAYVEHVASSNLLEFGVRRLRFYLADSPDDRAALRALDDLAGQLQSKVAVAEARVESDAEEFAEEVETIQQVLPWIVFVFILVAIGVISMIMFG
jgi:hypothetical protein